MCPVGEYANSKHIPRMKGMQEAIHQRYERYNRRLVVFGANQILENYNFRPPLHSSVGGDMTRIHLVVSVWAT